MSLNGWYVRLGDESIGPLTNEEFRELVLSGSIAPQTQVSPNQLNWTPAAQVQGLSFPSAPPPPPLPIGPGRDPLAQLININTLWKVIALSAFALLTIFVAVQMATPPSSQPSQASTGLSASPQQRAAANRTYVYWRQVSGIVKAAAAAPAGATTFRSTATSIEGLPTSGIDLDAVNCALGFATVLKEAANLIESENDPSATADQMLRAFYGGWSGDFQPLVHDLEGRSDAHKILGSHVKSVEQQMIHTRAVLSSRYGVEFPAF
jgi:hypothetical protein